MRDWDKHEEIKTSDISKFLFMVTIIFSIGFVVGIFWALAFMAGPIDELAVKAFAEPYIGPSLSETMSFGDEITVVLHSGT